MADLALGMMLEYEQIRRGIKCDRCPGESAGEKRLKVSSHEFPICIV